jgi:hypothetical protein
MGSRLPAAMPDPIATAVSTIIQASVTYSSRNARGISADRSCVLLNFEPVVDMAIIPGTALGRR